MAETHFSGKMAELAARMWLRCRGWRILGRRVHTPFGEIDIIARRYRTVIFVEVKLRAIIEEALSTALLPAQQQRIIRAARHWLARHPHLAGADCRFDMIAVARRGRLKHVPDIFRADATIRLW